MIFRKIKETKKIQGNLSNTISNSKRRHKTVHFCILLKMFVMCKYLSISKNISKSNNKIREGINNSANS